MKYVRLDKIKPSAHIESIVASEDLFNGQFLALGALQADGEARQATPSGDQAKQLVFHASVPLTYEERTNELDYVLKAGKVGRGYVLETGDIVSIDDTVLAKGDLVVPSPTGWVAGTPNAGEMHGEVIDIEMDAIVGRLAVIRVNG
ncbi:MULTISPECIES: hypothetical protein [Bacillus subtilis group]|uniref:hypothetical protein n=1 Tax=Bacillus subtilis group TaxID=653685 RepID=UPI00119D948D|nr:MULTISPECIES: hypothetical protein [Bacillus subtilis group]MCY8228682.1 hypothetical protein [Bacillus spizizenii]MEC2335103.1 hypothetical protein [Bacillus subtilis]